MISIHSVTSDEYPDQTNNPINSHENQPDKPEEACGVFGIYAPGENVAKLTYFGLYALQHRGQESAGIATFEGTQVHLHKDMGLVSQVFNESILDHLPGNLAVGHTRYSTTGSSRKVNAQPAILETRLGSLALAHNGNLVNTVQLRQELLEKKCNLITTTDSEMIAFAIAEAINAGADWLEGSIQAFHRCQGAFSLVIGTPNGVMGVRDTNGIRPLVIGTLAGNPVGYVLASETCGLDIIGAEYLRDVEPGELVWITEEGLASYHWSQKPQRKLCIFEMIYFARPDSVMHNESLYSYRMRLGHQLAKESFVDADIVFGVPDSGNFTVVGMMQYASAGQTITVRECNTSTSSGTLGYVVGREVNTGGPGANFYRNEYRQFAVGENFYYTVPTGYSVENMDFIYIRGVASYSVLSTTLSGATPDAVSGSEYRYNVRKYFA
ncbi:amidophosphoribosyltransferase, partial [Nostoc sp. CHAB 5715]|uniref:amidophosphoribosyltransferase n=1 Tax=Nostoc sp. CHAB 5715 TaxID=2780400 RepID=UPI001E477281